jgi:phosphoribosylanthranilate isomerase
MFIKICGLQTAAEIDAAVSNGADAIGFVFAESVRRITPEQAAQISADLPEDIIRVAVMLHPTPDEWHSVRDVLQPDWLQTDHEDFAQLTIGNETTPLPVFRDSESIDTDALQGFSRLLLEGKTSGKGEIADWNLAETTARQTSIILAGGLNPDNVGEAIQQTRPWGVDVSSGVEESPGKKSAAKIAAFIKAARRAENETDGTY